MSSFRFSRDEVILALDVLYSSKHERISADSDDIKDLSALLNRLPIHPNENRRSDFRTTTGITKQIKILQSNLRTGNRDNHVGAMFFKLHLSLKTSMTNYMRSHRQYAEMKNIS